MVSLPAPPWICVALLEAVRWSSPEVPVLDAAPPEPPDGAGGGETGGGETGGGETGGGETGGGDTGGGDTGGGDTGGGDTTTDGEKVKLLALMSARVRPC